MEAAELLLIMMQVEATPSGSSDMAAVEFLFPYSKIIAERYFWFTKPIIACCLKNKSTSAYLGLSESVGLPKERLE
jgi:hypothetical protein